MKSVRIGAALLLSAAWIAFSPAPSPAGVESLAAKTIEAYGGERALSKAAAVREAGWVTSTMRQGKRGMIRREYERPGRLRVEVSFPGEAPEVRILNGSNGWRGGERVTGPPFDAMVLQEARLALPGLLRDRLGEWKDRGVVSSNGREYRSLFLPLGGTLSLTVEIDAETGRIARSSGNMGMGTGSGVEFVTVYGDYREVDGILFAFREENYAMGVRTGETILERVEVRESLPKETFLP